MRFKHIIVIIFCFIIVFTLFADNEKNILIITVDTLRADHLSCYGYSKPTSPNIDKLSEEGVLFLSARTPIPTTSPAHATILTSLYPHNHKVIVNLAPLDRTVKTMSEILSEHGYITAAIISAWPLRAKGSGLEKGFNFYDDSFKNSYRAFQAEQLADKATNKALKWLSQNHGKKFFLWVHYFDPHYPYREHPKLNYLPIKRKRKAEKKGMTKLEKISYRYDREIAFTDFHIGRLLNALKEWKLDSGTIIIFTADHGESLGEHKYVGHGKYLYESSLHVPLIIKNPSVESNVRVIKENVSLVDIMPTILDSVDISTDIPMSGKSLVPKLRRNEKINDRIHYYMTFKTNLANIPILGKLKRNTFEKSFPDRICLQKNNMKFIYSAKNNRKELYNLTNDKHEIINLEVKNIELSKRLKSELIVWFNRTKSSGLLVNKYLILKKEDIERLKSLGYIN